MAKAFQKISIKLKKKRGDRGIREVAKEIEISPATLSRVESGKLPDLNSFSKICTWLNIDPNEFLACNTAQKKSSHRTSIHLKADKNITPELSKALADMILSARTYFD